MNGTVLHPSETAEYWERLAKAERTFAAQERGTRSGTAESIRIHEQNAKEYAAQADRIRRQQ